ncbi:mitochondrial ribosomal protein S23 [Cotesia typhae]|uniref:mitochondrial ribosomal protein S23 n=1 Tax=Cotesia typhae TaxID=2053667 RepID=UPI003D68F6B6
MAQSRLERIGTIFTRVQSLLKSGAVKWEDKPIWYDVYEAFPPKNEPRYDRVAPNIEISDIFYKEDIIRAKFQKEFGNNLRFNIARNDTQSHTQRFISIYQDLEKTGVSGNELWEKALEDFNKENTSFQLKSQLKDEKTSAKETTIKELPPTENVKSNVDLSKIFE